MSDFTGNSSGLQQRRLLSKRIYLLARQVMNCKVDTVVVSETITDFNDQVSTAVIANLALSLLCDTFVHTVKSNISNSSKSSTKWSNGILYFTGSGQTYRNLFCCKKSFVVFHQFAKLRV